MKCYLCGKTFFERRYIQTLFKVKVVFRCKSCEKKYPAYVTEQAIPKNSGLIYITSLFKEENNFNLLAYNQEIKKWFLKTINSMNKDDTIIWVDEVSDVLIPYLDLIDNDIYLLSKTLKYFS
ncbi:MAG: hypothetical protein PHF62_02225 [Acholeplasmataceae bacterium]|jgi:hypothetical protein|nr:hypothetical protein [Acholeplasmataceae bacterium]MDD4203922.1 hypothetical protein [Acholeplasmataceae bacterium]MDD4468550.1 hypothetical protein [Acholeplasmataceae bacterium]MDD4824558.1 hypothetical protein [Acholeplasmataceae bacterium]MDY0316271.1 hypothetical protein [Acholeplasmatales bacterium]